MTLHDFKIAKTGKSSTDYETVVNLLGGAKAFKPYMPADMATLRQSHAQDKYFNTDLTPLKSWDKAVGITVENRQGAKPVLSNPNGLVGFLRRNKITNITLSEGVCLLKTAAEMLIKSK